jgi:hypothetical protein
MLFSNLLGDVEQLPDGCVDALEAVGHGLPSATSFLSGVDGVQYISLDGPDLITGFTMCGTKSIKSLLTNNPRRLKQCSDDVNACFLSSLNRLRMGSRLGQLKENPPMKPAIIITSKESQCQIPHMDIIEHKLRAESFVGFIPLTKNGMYLEVWPMNDPQPSTKKHHGELIFIPLGVLLLLPATTVHGGGMKAPLPPMSVDCHLDMTNDIVRQHPRLHFYIFPTKQEADYKSANLYELPNDMRDKLETDKTKFSELFVHSAELQYTAENKGELALGLLNDINPIMAEQNRAPN